VLACAESRGFGLDVLGQVLDELAEREQDRDAVHDAGATTSVRLMSTTESLECPLLVGAAPAGSLDHIGRMCGAGVGDVEAFAAVLRDDLVEP